MPGRNGTGRPRENQNGYTFKPEELKIETYGSHTHALAIITHLPTGISAEGNDPYYPGSVLAAKAFALRALSKKLEEQTGEAYKASPQDPPKGPGEAAGTPGTTTH